MPTSPIAGDLVIPATITIPPEYIVTSIADYAFSKCPNLTSVTIPDSVTTLETGAFMNCYSLESIVLPSSISQIEVGVFSSCRKLTAIKIPEKITRIPDYTFEYCSVLSSVSLPSHITEIGSEAFMGCSRLREITVPASVTRIQHRAFQNCSSLVSIAMPEGVKEIEEATFRGCSGLTSVTIPDSVNYIGKDAFMGCHSLKSIRIPEAVTSIDEFAFASCALEEVDIPDSVTSIGWNAFAECSSLKRVNIGKQVKCGIIDGSSAMSFSRCFYWPYPRFNVSYENEYLQSHDGVLYSKDRMTLYAVPADYVALTIQLGVTNIYNCAISCNPHICHLTIPQGVKNVGQIYKCDSLREVTIPCSVETITGFRDCTNLTSIIFNGDAPTVQSVDFENMGVICKAYVKKNSKGFPAEGDDWHGLTVKYHGADVANGTIEANGDGGYTVMANEGTVLTDSDFTFTGVVGGEIVDTSRGYNISIAPDGQSAVLQLKKPTFGARTTAVIVDVGDASGTLDDAVEEELATKPVLKSGEELGALPVTAVPGLYYQAAWGDDISNLVSGEKVQANAERLYLGVVKQTGDKGFYKITVSEQ